MNIIDDMKDNTVRYQNTNDETLMNIQELEKTMREQGRLDEFELQKAIYTTTCERVHTALKKRVEKNLREINENKAE